jgi:hypothetical protein
MRSAFETIPSALVTGVQVICQYHRGEPAIASTFSAGPGFRLPFLAALMRFADELDVDAPRVAMADVKQFRLPPEDEVYWWVHNSTRIHVGDGNAVLIQVFLHPADMRLRNGLKLLFLESFRSKNRPITDFLNSYGMHIVFDAQSDVFPNEAYEKLPERIASRVRDFLDSPRYWVDETETSSALRELSVLETTGARQNDQERFKGSQPSEAPAPHGRRQNGQP